MIRLELDVTHPRTRTQLEQHYQTVFRLRRAVQRDARDRVDAYHAAKHERARLGAKQVRERLGLTRKGLEAAAKQHVEASQWMHDHVTKATGLHVADEVWNTVDRHLFVDVSGKRHGRPRVGSWWDFTRIPGRAKSHTKPATWETYRLVGSLGGHLSAYRHPTLTTPVGDADPGTPILHQPQHLPTPTKPAGSWWTYHGPLAVVYTGMMGGDLVLPVRLPSGAGEWAHLTHFLGRPGLWHKIDLVRVRDRRAPGGWRYYAHLHILGAGYVSESTRIRRGDTPTDRVACVDGNVRNLAVVSVPTNPDQPVTSTYVTITRDQQTAADRAAVTARRRMKVLDRSRRTANPTQYGLSARQAKRAARRKAAGLSEKHTTPGGARDANTAGVPKQAYRKDTLSDTYRRTRADHAAASRSQTQAKHARATQTAAQLVHDHGANWITEHTNIRTWAQQWGRGIRLFSPGMLLAALTREATQVGGLVRRASTYHTALSQYCLCGARVPKTLATRVHACPTCGLTGDRDLVSAALGTRVVFTLPTDPRSARVDQNLADALRCRLAAQQEALNRSNSTAVNTPDGVDGRAVSILRVPLPVASGIPRPTPEQDPTRERRRTRREKIPHGPFRTNS